MPIAQRVICSRVSSHQAPATSMRLMAEHYMFRDFLLINPDMVAGDPAGVLATLNAAIVANNAITGSTRGPISSPTSSTSAFFDITEKTNALYAQTNFSSRYLSRQCRSALLENRRYFKRQYCYSMVWRHRQQRSGSYDFVLPRFNLVADVSEDVVIRGGWGKDIRRPDFDDLSTSFTFSTSPNPAVNLGNPGLEPRRG